MSTLQAGDDCQSNDPNKLFPIAIESELRLPLDSSVRIMFTGYYNGFNVEIHASEEITLLYHMGCFGKGSASRSRPTPESKGRPVIMRKRQFFKRVFWSKKFSNSKESVGSDEFLKDVDMLTSKIIANCDKEANRDVIDLVSSDDDDVIEDADDLDQNMSTLESRDINDMVVTVPNSDSEGENYFENFQPKCCINKISLKEKLMLTPQEAFFLVYGLGCLQIFDNENKLMSLEQTWLSFINTDKQFLYKYVVYHYFRSKGYIVKPGVKFGGDYLLYKEGPGIAHADYIVMIKSDRSLHLSTWMATLGHIRMAATTVKELLICEVYGTKSTENNIVMPEDLRSFSVRELLLTRNIPIQINEDEDG